MIYNIYKYKKSNRDRKKHKDAKTQGLNQLKPLGTKPSYTDGTYNELEMLM